MNFCIEFDKCFQKTLGGNAHGQIGGPGSATRQNRSLSFRYFNGVLSAIITSAVFLSVSSSAVQLRAEDDKTPSQTEAKPDADITQTDESKTEASASNPDLAKQLLGTWKLVGEAEKGAAQKPGQNCIKSVTNKYWIVTEYDLKSGEVLFHHGGTYKLDGDNYIETVEFANENTKLGISKSSKFKIKLDGDTLTIIGIGNPWTQIWKRADEGQATAADNAKKDDETKTGDTAKSDIAQQLIGTWTLAGEAEKDVALRPGEKRLKTFTKKYWIVTESTASSGVVQFHHGGTYQLDGDNYIETGVFANPSTKFTIGGSGKYKIKINGDTLMLIGIGNPWTEVWKRAD